MSEWIKCSDLIPQHGQPVNVAFRDGEVGCAVYGSEYGRANWWHEVNDMDDSFIDGVITHWMPLPAPPKVHE